MAAGVRGRDHAPGPDRVTARLAVAVDIGGTKIAAGLVGASGLVGTPVRILTDASQGAAAVLERLLDLVASVSLEAARDGGHGAPVAVGVSTGGWVDRHTDRVRVATDLLPGWADLDLAGRLRETTGRPVTVCNDGHAMAIAEARLGAGRDAHACLSVAVGTGIGGGITIDGVLLEGAQGMAGAVGHVVVRRGGHRCSCGRRGCLESEASGPAIARSYAASVARPGDVTTATAMAVAGSGPDGLRDLVEALGSGDPSTARVARRVVRQAGRTLGRAIGGVVQTIDADRVVLGGGVTDVLGEDLLGPVRAAVMSSTLQPVPVRVVAAQAGPWAGLIGAGLLALTTP